MNSHVCFPCIFSVSVCREKQIQIHLFLIELKTHNAETVSQVYPDWETPSQRALRNCSKENREGRGQCVCGFGQVGVCSQTHILVGGAAAHEERVS